MSHISLQINIRSIRDYCFNAKYGSRCIELSKGKNAPEVADLNALIEALSPVKLAVLAGELDAEIEQAVRARRQNRAWFLSRALNDREYRC